MDILASMLAYLVCVTGMVAALAMSFVVFFSAPGEFSAPPPQAIVMVAPARPIKTARASPVETIAKPADQQNAVDAAEAKAVPPPTIALDARQKPLISQAHSHLRRLAEKERERQLAYRERPSFETRFLHYDD